MRIKNDSGISLTTVVITVIVIIILAAISVTYSLQMISEAGEAKNEAEIYADNEIIRNLLTQSLADPSVRVGYPLLDGNLVVIGSGNKEYGSGWYLVPGGEEDEEVDIDTKEEGDLKKIRFKIGDDTLKAYRGLTAPYVVDYYYGTYERVEDIKFK